MDWLINYLFKCTTADPYHFNLAVQISAIGFTFSSPSDVALPLSVGADSRFFLHYRQFDSETFQHSNLKSYKLFKASQLLSTY
jgi:hypothetical protein